jgi:hypothetical protein
MSDTDVAVVQDWRPQVASQGTVIEQSRAVAEVQAMAIVAQQQPRDLQRVMAEVREACRQMPLAERAFYSFRRAGTSVNGESIHLARELARCFGNLTYGITELHRGDEQSEMLAYAWDVQANSRVASSFIVPHYRDTKDGVTKLPDLRSIYEQNANQGARRLREAIFAVLPTWLVQEAADLCRATLKDGGGRSLPQRIADAIGRYEAIGVTPDRLETRIGRPAAKWNVYDVAQLATLWQSIDRGEATAADEFPERRVTADDIVGAPAPAGAPVIDDDWHMDLARCVDEGDLAGIDELRAAAEAAGRQDLAATAASHLQAAAQ